MKTLKKILVASALSLAALAAAPRADACYVTPGMMASMAAYSAVQGRDDAWRSGARVTVETAKGTVTGAHGDPSVERAAFVRTVGSRFHDASLLGPFAHDRMTVERKDGTWDESIWMVKESGGWKAMWVRAKKVEPSKS